MNYTEKCLEEISKSLKKISEKLDERKEKKEARIKKSCKIQKTKRGVYVNIPKDIVDKMNLTQSEIAIISILDNDTMEIKILGDVNNDN